MSKYSPSKRKYMRKLWRRNNGWPESMLDAPPEPRQCREELYHKVVELVYSEPELTVPKVAERLSVHKYTVANTLRDRRTCITEIRAEARELSE